MRQNRVAHVPVRIMLRRKTIRTQKRQIKLVVDSVAEDRAFCPKCSGPTRIVSPLLAAMICNISTREIYRRIESASIHFIEHRDRQLFICLDSLRASLG